MGLPVERDEKNLWLIQRYHGHALYSDHGLEQSLLWDVETLVKMLLRLQVMSVDEIYVKMTYERGFPPIVDVYVCGRCYTEPTSINTQMPTDVYSCIVALVTTNCNHENHVRELKRCEDSSVLSYTAKYSGESTTLLGIVGFSAYFNWCAPWLSRPGYYDGREWIRDRRVKLSQESELE